MGRHGQACAGPFIRWNQGPRLFPLPSRGRVLSQHTGPGPERLEASEEGVEAGRGKQGTQTSTGLLARKRVLASVRSSGGTMDQYGDMESGQGQAGLFVYLGLSLFRLVGRRVAISSAART
jgi:hypothetical protein